jgi:RNA polymerase sigma-70 factor, ECF subfamily
MTDSNRSQQFVRLLEEASPRILAYLDALLLNRNDAEDVFQEACIVLWQKFDEFQPDKSFLAWALGIAQNKAMHLQRSSSRRNALLWKPETQASLMDAVMEMDASHADGAMTALSGCLDRLADLDRQLVQRCYGEGISVRQVADELGRSPQSVHNSLRRVRANLLECVERTLDQEQRR